MTIWTIDAITLNFSTKLDFSECSMGFGVIKFFGNFWWIFRRFIFIQSNMCQILTPDARELDPPIHLHQFNYEKIRYVSDPLVRAAVWGVNGLFQKKSKQWGWEHGTSSGSPKS